MNEIYTTDVYAGETLALGVVAVMLLIYLLVFGIAVANYIMNSLGLYKIAERRQIPNPWMAWLPFTNDWLVGSIADDYDGRNGIKRKWRVVLLTLSILVVGGIVVMYVGMFISVFVFAFRFAYTEPAVSDILGLVIFLYVSLFAVMFVAIAQSFFKVICIYKIFESTVPEKSVKYMLIYLLVPLGTGISLMLCRKKGYPFPQEPVQVDSVQPKVVQLETVEECTESNPETEKEE